MQLVNCMLWLEGWLVCFLSMHESGKRFPPGLYTRDEPDIKFAGYPGLLPDNRNYNRISGKVLQYPVGGIMNFTSGRIPNI